MPNSKNRYAQIIETIFLNKYQAGLTEIAFERLEITRVARKLKIKLPKNLGDILYSFRYRTQLPASISRKAPKGSAWIIRPAGRARYKFVLAAEVEIVPSKLLVETKIPDATPGIIAKYSLNDEQALLAKIRYNRLIDIFTGLTCYSLQNHLRTTVASLGQVETDEIYVGLDKRGVHYVLPVQAKSKADRIGIVQIEQDFAVGAEKFSRLVCRPIATQFIGEDTIALFEFEQTETGIGIASEKHYRLVHPDKLTTEELVSYQDRTS